MSRSPRSRARYRHKRATARLAAGVRKTAVPELKLPDPKQPGKRKRAPV